MTTTTTTPDSKTAESKRLLAQQAKAKAKADAEAEKLNKGSKDKPTTKPTTKPKPSVEKISRMEALGIVIRLNPKDTDENIIKRADTLYSDKTGKESNVKETALCYSYVKRFLKGYNA